ncbi:MAG: response regulator [Pseudomonadota bacterium]
MINQILILTADPTDANILTSVLGKASDGPFKIEWLTLLATGLERLRKGGIDAILVDLSLPDSSGIATFDQLYAEASHTPIMTLSEEEEEPLAIEAVARGAQGYLSKGHFGSYLVPQSLRNIIQRKAVEEAFYKEKARAEIALNSIGDAVICTDTSGNIDGGREI